MPVESSPENEEYSQQDLQDMLPIYYKRLFPHKHFHRWLTYGRTEGSIFTHREFSFTLMDDVYIRYLSYEDPSEFEADLCQRNPFKIDIGPVMSGRPKDHRTTTLVAIQRELIFDIDMTDYDEVRTCCSGAEVCTKCWKFMSVACQILDAALKEDFNFEHILWVFSGRRGIHCWTCDKTARHLSLKNRNAVAEYLNLFSSNSRITIGDRMHHSVKRAYRIVESYFDEILAEQNFFGTIERRKKLLDLVNDENVRKELESRVLAFAEDDSKGVWNLVKQTLNNIRGPKANRMKYNVEEIQLTYLYPRLDIAVSKATNHLLKAPFCVHPKTGKICVPFNPNAVSKFDPTTVPTMRKLLKSIDSFDNKNVNDEDAGNQSRIKEYKKTEMKKEVFIFEEFLRKLESSFKNSSRLQVSDAKMEF